MSETKPDAVQIPYDEFLELEDQLALFVPRVSNTEREVAAVPYPQPAEVEWR